jgi:hypothetical protein
MMGAAIDNVRAAAMRAAVDIWTMDIGACVEM